MTSLLQNIQTECDEGWIIADDMLDEKRAIDGEAVDELRDVAGRLLRHISVLEDAILAKSTA